MLCTVINCILGIICGFIILIIPSPNQYLVILQQFALYNILLKLINPPLLQYILGKVILKLCLVFITVWKVFGSSILINCADSFFCFEENHDYIIICIYFFLVLLFTLVFTLEMVIISSEEEEEEEDQPVIEA